MKSKDILNELLKKSAEHDEKMVKMDDNLSKLNESIVEIIQNITEQKKQND